MGRPLYFGNTSTGSDSTTADDFIVGQSVAGVTIDPAGNYTAKPTVTFSTPNMPNGVRATGSAVMTAISATVVTSGTGDKSADYAPGDLLTVSGDTGTAAVFEVASVKVRTAATETGGTTVWTTGDTVTFSTGWATPAIFKITADAGLITSLTYDGSSTSQLGIISGTIPTDPVEPDSATVADAGGYKDDATFNIGFGVNAVTVSDGGLLTALGSNPHATTTDSTNGTGCTLTMHYGVSDINITEPGSGYTNAADAAITFGSGAAAATAVLTTNQKGIIAYAKTTSGGTNIRADIEKQTNARSYKVTTTDGTAICMLKTSAAANAAGEMTIMATDSSSKTYRVAKLTSRKAVIVPYGAAGHEFPLNDDGTAQSVKWTLGDAILNDTVTIENA